MQSINKAILIGNLGRDPELRYTSAGTPVTNFSIATTESWDNADGQRQEHTEWHNIVAWAGLAETIAKYLSKGSRVYVEGRIQTRKWEGRDGGERRTSEIVINRMVMLDGRKPDDSDDIPDDISDDDIPF